MAPSPVESNSSNEDTLHNPTTPQGPITNLTLHPSATAESISHQSGIGPLGIHRHHPHEFFQRRRSSQGRRRSSAIALDTDRRRSSTAAKSTITGKKWWRFHFRNWDDNLEQSWWFASTAIPLLAATIGPLANVLSIAALVTSWRMCLITDVDASGARECAWNRDDALLGPELEGHDFSDPRWCYYMNVVSLIVGFIGNFFLLCNFTNRIRYIIALPVTIVCWYIATGILIGITVAMEIYEAPVRPQQTYTQGFWYAVIAACMYMLCAMLLMINMLGYFLGHYPQHFQLTESQRTLILQTMLFFVWLAGGGAMFSKVEQVYGTDDASWSFTDALYFCDVTILTVGFGDLYPKSDVGRGLVFPYSVGGIIMLGLMVSSITTFARELGSEKVVGRHIERSRVRTMDRTVTSSLELERRKTLVARDRPAVSAPFDARDLEEKRTITFGDDADDPKANTPPTKRTGTIRTLIKASSLLAGPQRRAARKPKLLLLREEKDRFDAMRKIQANTSRFKNWYALFLSVTAFGTLWCVGAVVFWQAEMQTQGMTYFQALYFCYVSLLTIGYGDLSPKSNAGRPFFVFWSLIAVPTMTILVSDLGETVINKFKDGTSGLADFTVLPQKGIWRKFLNQHPWLLEWLQQKKQRHDAKKRLEDGFQYGPEEANPETPTLDDLAVEEPSESDLAIKLAAMIKKVTDDLKDRSNKHYSYEEWVEFTQLIRFTGKGQVDRAGKDGEEGVEEEEEDMVEWDWIGEDSPMMAKKSEAEFVLDRLCESLGRYVRGKERGGRVEGRGGGKVAEEKGERD